MSHKIFVSTSLGSLKIISVQAALLHFNFSFAKKLRPAVQFVSYHSKLHGGRNLLLNLAVRLE